MILRAALSAALLPLAALGQLQIFNGTIEVPVGGLLNLGTAAPGDTITAHLRVRNSGIAAVTLNTLALAGEGFTITSVSPSLPFSIAPGTSPAAEEEVYIAFQPETLGSYSAFMTANGATLAELQGTSAAGATVTWSG